MRTKHLMVLILLVALLTAVVRGHVTAFDTERRGYCVPGYYADLDAGFFRIVYLNTVIHGLKIELQPAAGKTVVLYQRHQH